MITLWRIFFFGRGKQAGSLPSLAHVYHVTYPSITRKLVHNQSISHVKTSGPSFVTWYFRQCWQMTVNTLLEETNGSNLFSSITFRRNNLFFWNSLFRRGLNNIYLKMTKAYFLKKWSILGYHDTWRAKMYLICIFPLIGAIPAHLCLIMMRILKRFKSKLFYEIDHR